MKFAISTAREMENQDHRLDASYHASEGVKALRFIRRWADEPASETEYNHTLMLREERIVYNVRRIDKLPDVCIPNGVYIPSRFKRIFVDNEAHGAPYITGSSLLETDPKRGAKFLSYRFTSNLDELALRNRMTLVTCSGTIGNTAYVNTNFAGTVGSPDLLRLIADEEKIPPGYLYTFIGSDIGRALIQQKTYGAVVQHIEAHHVMDLPIPRLHTTKEAQIHVLVEQAAALRVEATKQITELQQQLESKILEIPVYYQPRWPSERSYDTRVINLNNHLRLDAFHFVGYSAEYEPYLKPGPLLADIASVRLPGKFKRMYTGPEGIPYLSGIDVFQLKVTPRLWLSRRQPELPNLTVTQNGTILVQADGSRNGLIGRPAYVDELVVGCAFSNHLAQIQPHSLELGGYIFLFLSTRAGRSTLLRHSCGTAIPTIPENAFKTLLIPGGDTKLAKQLGRDANEALAKRTQATKLENEAQLLLLNALGWNAKNNL